MAQFLNHLCSHDYNRPVNKIQLLLAYGIAWYVMCLTVSSLGTAVRVDMMLDHSVLSRPELWYVIK